MSLPPGIGSSHEEHSSGRSAATWRPPAIVAETVFNPEGRRPAGSSFATSGDVEPAAAPSAADSHIWRRLFPSEADLASGDESNSPAGCELGHFTVEERIGAGGMGAVFRALDGRLQRVVALKVLSPGQSRDRSAVQRFRNEARAAARLDHENVARVFYVGEDRGLHFIAFEYVTGRNVRELITAAGRLPVADAVNYVLQIAQALRHTAAAGVVHRDIKPSNVIVTPAGRAKLVDLGLARKLAQDSIGDLTIAGTTLGTFDYISPEQARDPRGADVRSDIYSLGCTLYHMLTGSPPYANGTVLQNLLDRQTKDAPDPRAANPQVPAALAAVCLKMMAGDPRNRHATPDDLLKDLAPIAASLGLRPTPAEGLVWTRPPAPRSPAVRSGAIWAASIAVVLLFALLADRLPMDTDAAADPRPGESDPAFVAEATGGPRPSETDELPPDLPPEQSEPELVDDPRELVANVPPSAGTPPEPAGLPVRSASSAVMASAEETSIAGAVPARTEVFPGAVTQDRALPPDRVLPVTDETGPTAPAAPAWPSLESALETLLALARPDADTAPAVPAAGGPSPRDTVASDEPATPAARPAGTPVGEAPQLGSRPVADFAGPVFLKTVNGEPGKFDSLADAVAAAVDGDTIELRYDGVPPWKERPFRIDRKEVTIKAGEFGGRTYRPVVEFTDDALPAGRTAMIALVGGRLTVEDVEFRVAVRGSAEQWSLFSLPSGERVRLRGVNVTLNNPAGRPLTVFDLRPIAGVPTQQTALMMGGTPEGFHVGVENCLIRGEADLVTVAHTLSGEVDVRDSAVALRSALLNVIGGADEPLPEDRLTVTLDHVTAILGDGLLRMDVADLEVTPIRVEARRCVLTTDAAGPLVSLSGRRPAAELLDALSWYGDENAYENFAPFLSAFAADTSGVATTLDANRWRRHWGERKEGATAEILPRSGGVVWETGEWKVRRLSEVVGDDLALDSQADAAMAGSDGAELGAPVDRLPRPLDAPARLSRREPPVPRG